MSLAAVVPEAAPATGPEVIIAQIRSASERRALPEALALWRRLNADYPDNPDGYAGEVQCLRAMGRLTEAEFLAEQATSRFSDDRLVNIESARVAFDRRDLTLAIERWQRVVSKFPDVAEGYIGLAQALRVAGHGEAAETLAVASISKFPREPAFLSEHALAATNRRDFTEATKRWLLMRDRFPSHPGAYTGQIRCLRLEDRFAEADALAELAIERFPKHADGLAEHARVADARRDWPEALARWERMHTQFPQLAEGLIQKARALRLLSRIDEAEALLLSARERFALDARLFSEFTVCAFARKDWAEAMKRSEDVRRRFPDAPDGWTRGISALLTLGRYEDAETLAATAPASVLTDAGVLIQKARAAAGRRDWAEALRRWQTAQHLYPELVEIKDGLGAAQIGLQFAAADVGTPSTQEESTLVDEVPAADASSDLQLLKGFESLGGNCEFGMVQGMAGVHTLGLLRWCSLRPSQLRDAVASRFGGVGLPENTAVELNEDGEYRLRDTRYFYMHTFIKEGQVASDKIFGQMCRRLVFLKAKLISDLKDADKIFVYKTVSGEIGNEEIDEIWRAMQEYGSSNLLCVRLAGAPHQAGDVEKLAPGRFVGYLDRLPPTLIRSEISYDCWLSICRRVATMISA